MPRIPSRRTVATAAGTAVVLTGGAAVALALAPTSGATAPAAATPTATPTANPTPAPFGPRHGGPGGHRFGGPDGFDGPGGRGGPGRRGAGTVVSVTPTSLVVKGQDGSSTTYALTSATTYHRGQASEARTDLAPGDRVHVRLADGSTTARTAADVEEVVPHLVGTVVSVTADTIVITDGEGFQRTVRTTAATTYTKDGAAATRPAVTTGARVRSGGSIDSDKTSLDAATVDVLTKAPGPDGPADGRRGPGFGPGFGPSAAAPSATTRS